MGSNAIEGINVTMDEAMAAVNREPPEKAAGADGHAVWGHRVAMDYVTALSKPPQRYAAVGVGVSGAEGRAARQGSRCRQIAYGDTPTIVAVV